MDKENAKNVLFELKKILDACNIEFWLNYATCVGAYRDKAFCEHDKDIDLGVKHENIVPKIDLLKDTLKQHGFLIMAISKPYIYERALKVKKLDVPIDIIDYAISGNERFHPHYIHDHAVVHDASLFNNLQTIDFLGQEFLIPNPVEEFLISIYGEDWHIPNLVYNFPDDYRNYREHYWQATIYHNLTKEYYETMQTAWEKYQLGLKEHFNNVKNS